MKAAKSSTLFFLAIITLAQLQFFSCRSRKRTAAIDDAAPELAVTILDLRDEDKNQANFRYILNGCGSGDTVNGVVTPGAANTDPVVKFNVKNLKAGEVCAMRIKIDSLAAYPSKINFTDEDLTMYTGNDGVVTQGLKGEYVATMNMKPNYFHELPPLQPDSQYSINVNILFPEPVIKPELLTAFLYCNPEVKHLPSAFNAASATSGQFTFKAIHAGTGPEEHMCDKITVYNGETRQYFGRINTQIFKFAATAGQTIDFGTANIRLEKVIPPPAIVNVETIEGKQCDPEKEVFDIIKKACVPKPGQ